MDMKKYDLSWSVGFIADTTLAFTRIIFDGFLDLYPNLKLIASHGGGALPYLVGRFDKGDEVEIPSRRRVKARPSEYLKRIWYDCITYHPAALAVPDFDRRRRPRAVRHRLSAPGARHEGLDGQHRGAAGRCLSCHPRRQRTRDLRGSETGGRKLGIQRCHLPSHPRLAPPP